MVYTADLKSAGLWSCEFESRLGYHKMKNNKNLFKLIRASLTDDLRKKPWRGSDNHFSGHCYVASEAAYHLLGGKNAGIKPCSIKHEGCTHWFLNWNGEIIDLTVEQFDEIPKYEKARGRGFLTKLPSKRAQILISRVLKRLGNP